MSNQIDQLLNMPSPGGTLPILADQPEPTVTTPTSSIDATIPVYGTPTTQSVRDNFATTKTEITALMQVTQGAPFMPAAGGHFSGPVYLYNDPTDVMMPVTLGYFDAHGGGGSGGGGIPEAPTDGKFYTRSQGAWVPGVALAGGALSQMTGELLLAANPTSALGAVPKQYADAIATTANGAVPLAGGSMTGLLVLSADPTAALGAVTKQYADTGLALKAPINAPTFTGTVTTASRLVVSGPSGPAIALYDTTAGRPIFGLGNTGGLLSIGLALPGGNPSGTPFATCDQTGNWLFSTRVNVTGGRLIASGNNNPAVTLNNTGGSNIFSLWNNSGILNFGLGDANGAPQTQLATMDNVGNIWTNGTISTTKSVYLSAMGSVIDFQTSQSQIYSDQNYFITALQGGATASNAWKIMFQRTNGSYFLINYQGITLWNFDGGGNLSIAGTLYQSSDERLKDDIAEADDGIEIVRRLTPKRFTRKPYDDPPEGMTLPTPRRQLGFVAQDVEEALPEAVAPINDDRLGIDHTAILATAINAIKQLDARLSALEGGK